MKTSVEKLAKYAKGYGYEVKIVIVGWEKGYLEIKNPKYRCELGGIAFSRIMKVSTIEKTLERYFGKLPF